MGLFAQIRAFLLTLVLGVVAGLIFHYYQAVIRNLKVGRILLYSLDLILWVIMLLIIGIALLLINKAEIRAYVFIALFLGGVVYYKTVSPHLRRPVFIIGQSSATIIRAGMAATDKTYRLAVGWMQSGWRKLRRPPLVDDDDEDS